MLELFNENYFIDLDAIEQYLDIPDAVGEVMSGTSEVKINVVKFEMLKMLLDTMLTEQEIPDEKMGKRGMTTVSIPFRLSFNTLLNKKLIKYY